MWGNSVYLDVFLVKGQYVVVISVSICDVLTVLCACSVPKYQKLLIICEKIVIIARQLF